MDRDEADKAIEWAMEQFDFSLPEWQKAMFAWVLMNPAEPFVIVPRRRS